MSNTTMKVICSFLNCECEQYMKHEYKLKWQYYENI